MIELCSIACFLSLMNAGLFGRHIFTVVILFLKDRIPPFPTPEALKFFESEFGLPASKVFAEISEKPVAAASLGQVYRGITTRVIAFLCFQLLVGLGFSAFKVLMEATLRSKKLMVKLMQFCIYM